MGGATTRAHRRTALRTGVPSTPPRRVAVGCDCRRRRVQQGGAVHLLVRKCRGDAEGVPLRIKRNGVSRGGDVRRDPTVVLREGRIEHWDASAVKGRKMETRFGGGVN